MLIKKVSALSGKENEREIDVTQEHLDKWNKGMMIQDAMPHLSPDDREFLLTGATPEEWEKFMGEDEDDLPPDAHDAAF